MDLAAWLMNGPPTLERVIAYADNVGSRCLGLELVMAGLVPAIHDPSRGTKNVEARDKTGRDALETSAQSHMR